jgi:uncharacterized protein (DUF58 family)
MLLTRPIRFTRFGTFYVLFAIGVGAAAINTGNNLLYLILGILLGFIVISGFLSDSGLWGITTEWSPNGSLYAGEKAMFDCRAYKGWFPGVAVAIESHWKNLEPVSQFVPWIPAKSSVLLRTEVTPSKRGILTLEKCLYSTRFPFGLFQKTHTLRMNEHWVVYPALRRLPWNFLERYGRNLSLQASARAGMGAIPFLLRDYRAGDALRQVQWKASAKRGRLIVHEMEEEANRGEVLVLHAWPIDFDAKKMEDFISFLASLAFTLYDHGRPVGLLTPERTFPPEHSRAQLNRIFEYLALVNPFDSKQHPMTDKTHRQWSTEQAEIDVLTLWRSYASER